MGASGTDNFCLRWNDFAENVSGAFKDLRAESDFFDVTLACSDSGVRTLQAHKVILSACSNFFKTTFRQQQANNKHPNPYIYLRGVFYNDLISILDFIYNGEVNVAQEDLNSFLAVAEELQIKGLTNRDNNASNSDGAGSATTTTSRKTPTAAAVRSRPAAVVDQPPVKKIRRSSPAPNATASASSAQKLEVPAAEEVKEVVNIKDDPEALASTSAVNPDDAGPEFGGEDYDESYDGYYEDDGTELGDGGEGADGTKDYATSVLHRFNENNDDKIYSTVNSTGNVEYVCAICNRYKSNLKSSVKVHLVGVHANPSDRVRCTACGRHYKNDHELRRHFKRNRCKPIF